MRAAFPTLALAGMVLGLTACAGGEGAAPDTSQAVASAPWPGTAAATGAPSPATTGAPATSTATTAASSAATGPTTAGPFTPATSPDKEAVLARSRELASATARNDMRLVCSQLTDETGTQPLKDDPMLLDMCVSGLQESIGGGSQEAVQARSGYGAMTFQRAEQSGDEARTFPQVDGQEMGRTFALVRLGGAWYVHTTKTFNNLATTR